MKIKCKLLLSKLLLLKIIWLKLISGKCLSYIGIKQNIETIFWDCLLDVLSFCSFYQISRGGGKIWRCLWHREFCHWRTFKWCFAVSKDRLEICWKSLQKGVELRQTPTCTQRHVKSLQKTCKIVATCFSSRSQTTSGRGKLWSVAPCSLFRILNTWKKSYRMLWFFKLHECRVFD